MIQVLMIVKDADDVLINTLNSYINQVDRFCILDTYSTDNTWKLLQEFKKLHPTELYQEPFQGFSKTRNRLIDLSKNKDYKWSIFIDDSYELIGNLKEALKNANENSYRIKIKTHTIEYLSKRIFQKAYYKGNIHEVLDTPDKYTLPNVYLYDRFSIKENDKRKNRNDLIHLKDTPRDLYYKGCIYNKKYSQNEATKEEVIFHLNNRINTPSDNHEETFLMTIILAHFYNHINEKQQSLKNFIKASIIFPDRSGECYYFIYLITNIEFYIKKAYENRFNKSQKPCNSSIYGNNGKISQAFNSSL